MNTRLNIHSNFFQVDIEERVMLNTKIEPQWYELGDPTALANSMRQGNDYSLESK